VAFPQVAVGHALTLRRGDGLEQVRAGRREQVDPARPLVAIVKAALDTDHHDTEIQVGDEELAGGVLFLLSDFWIGVGTWVPRVRGCHATGSLIAKSRHGFDR
jgi:hypothetical protein